MFGFLAESMLREYFAATAIFGQHIKDRKFLFGQMGKIYLLPDDEIEELFALTEREEVVGISTEKEYFRYRRVRQYFSINDPEYKDDGIDDIVIIKGNALSEATECKIFKDSETSQTAASRLLTHAADSGNVLALNILGILQMEGIIFRQDKKAGLKNIDKSASWHNEDGLLATLYYGGKHKNARLASLQNILAKASHTEAAEAVEAAYGKCSSKSDQLFRLLEKAFDEGILKRETYSKQYARLLFSDVINFKDKEALFLSCSKDEFDDAADLPLKLSQQEKITCDLAGLESIYPDRKDEIARLVRGLDNSAMCGTAYKPVCIVSDSKFILRNIASAIEDGADGAHVEKIEVADISDYDLEPTKNNIFIRSCDEDSTNLYIIFFEGEIPERIFDPAKNFTQADKRAKFRLNRPSVCLDMRSVIPVCFCDRENVKHLRQYCDVINISGATRAEKSLLIDVILKQTGARWGLESVTVTGDVREKLTGYSVDRIVSLIETVIRNNCGDGATLELNGENTGKYIKEQATSSNSFGFGGN